LTLPVLTKPLALHAGDRIRLVAPASPFDRKKLEAGVAVLSRLGFVPKVHRCAWKKAGYLAGSDHERGESLLESMRDPACDAVWCIRGGYGTTRLLPHFNPKELLARPKVLVGFSDVTALLLQLSKPKGVVTIHGPVVTQLPEVPEKALRWLTKVLCEPHPAGEVPWGQLRTIHRGTATGRLLGGNLSILASMVGTPFFPPLDGAILFLEEVGEQAYRLDRMFEQLLQSGSLKRISGLLLGSLAGCSPAGRGKYSARAVLERRASELKIPTASGADFGHQPRNFALPEGINAELNATRGTLTLLEPAVRSSP
jgi:muramoyltetrapeptide carboxypeptidase